MATSQHLAPLTVHQQPTLCRFFTSDATAPRRWLDARSLDYSCISRERRGRENAHALGQSTSRAVVFSSHRYATPSTHWTSNHFALLLRTCHHHVTNEMRFPTCVSREHTTIDTIIEHVLCRPLTCDHHAAATGWNDSRRVPGESCKRDDARQCCWWRQVSRCPFTPAPSCRCGQSARTTKCMYIETIDVLYYVLYYVHAIVYSTGLSSSECLYEKNFWLFIVCVCACVGSRL